MAVKAQYCKWCFSAGISYDYYKNLWENSDKHLTENCSKLKIAAESGTLRAVKLFNKVKSGGGRVCGYCGALEHTSAKCAKKFNELKASLLKQKVIADEAFEYLHRVGFGPGCVISTMARERSYRAKQKDYNVVVVDDFKRGGANFFTELLYGSTRNWYPVNATDAGGEIVRHIYLPYDEKYSPRPTAKKAEVITKASYDDIEAMKTFVACYKNNAVLDFNTAEEFFAAGYKFTTGNSKYNISVA